MTEPSKGLLIVLERREQKSVEIPGSSSQRLVTALRRQILTAGAAKSSGRWSDRWKRNLGHQNRGATLVLVSILFILSLSFGLRSAFQIRQAEGAGFSISEIVGGLFTAREPEGVNGSAVGEATPTPQSALETYGAIFSWPDRFSEVEVQRETMSSRVLWPISTLISTLILGAWILPRSDR